MGKLTEAMGTHYNIICFGFLPWSSMWKRNQSMMAEMAKWDFIHQLIFVNPTVSLRTEFNRQNKVLKNHFIDSNPHLLPGLNIKFTVVTPKTLLPGRSVLPAIGKLEDKITLNLIRRLNKHKPYILVMNCPNIVSSDILDELLKNAVLSIFDISDDFLELGYDRKVKEFFSRNMNRYVQASDIALAVNEHVKNKYAYLNANMHVIRNGTNFHNFDQPIYKTVGALEKIKQNYKPIIGYIGMANMGRIDGDLLDYLVKQRSDWQFLFIGPAHARFTKRYADYGNIHILAPVSYEELPCYIRYFNVAIVPFCTNANTKGNDLLKLHDFLAMGTPVVSTDIGGAEDMQDVITVAKTAPEFLEGIERALKFKGDADVLRRKSVAKLNSWPCRVRALEQLIKEKLSLSEIEEH